MTRCKNGVRCGFSMDRGCRCGKIRFVRPEKKLKAPFVLPHDSSWKGLSAEEIYEKYPSSLKLGGSSGGQESEHIKRGAGMEGADSFDSHPLKDGGESCDERLKAVVAIDTSGSTSEDLPKFFGELTALLGAFGGYDLTVIQCDADVANVEKFDDANPLDPKRQWEMHGGGGTSFKPVFDYVDAHPELEPSLLVYFTDGYGDAPERAPRYPVLWLVTQDGCQPATWGTTVWFKGT